MHMALQEDTEEGLCVGPGVYPKGVKGMEIIWFWYFNIIHRFLKDYPCFSE